MASRDEILKQMDVLYSDRKEAAKEQEYVYRVYPDTAYLLTNSVEGLTPTPGKYTKLDFTYRQASVYVYWPSAGDDKTEGVHYCPFSLIQGNITKE